MRKQRVKEITRTWTSDHHIYEWYTRMRRQRSIHIKRVSVRMIVKPDSSHSLFRFYVSIKLSRLGLKTVSLIRREESGKRAISIEYAIEESFYHIEIEYIFVVQSIKCHLLQWSYEKHDQNKTKQHKFFVSPIQTLLFPLVAVFCKTMNCFLLITFKRNQLTWKIDRITLKIE